MKIRKTLVIPLAGLLAVAAAGAVLATSGGAPAAGMGGAVNAASSPSPAPSAPANPLPGKAGVAPGLTAVLDQLVAKGTITAAQKTAILDALTAERADRQAERKQIRTFLADGVITKDELAQLPADNPLRQLTSLMDDGKITIDELRSVGREFVRGLGGRMGGGRMGGGRTGGGWGAPGGLASPAPSAGSGG